MFCLEILCGRGWGEKRSSHLVFGVFVLIGTYFANKDLGRSCLVCLCNQNNVMKSKVFFFSLSRCFKNIQVLNIT